MKSKILMIVSIFFSSNMQPKPFVGNQSVGALSVLPSPIIESIPLFLVQDTHTMKQGIKNILTFGQVNKWCNQLAKNYIENDTQKQKSLIALFVDQLIKVEKASVIEVRKFLEVRKTRCPKEAKLHRNMSEYAIMVGNVSAVHTISRVLILSNFSEETQRKCWKHVIDTKNAAMVDELVKAGFKTNITIPVGSDSHGNASINLVAYAAQQDDSQIIERLNKVVVASGGIH